MSIKKWIQGFIVGAILVLAGPVIGHVAAHAEAVKNVTPEKYNTVTKLEVFWMYTMKTRFWQDGTKITVFYLDFSDRNHEDFCRDVLNVSTDRFARNVEIYINNGNASYFHQVAGESDMYSHVAKTAGGIGYVSKDYLLVNRGLYVQKMRIID